MRHTDPSTQRPGQRAVQAEAGCIRKPLWQQNPDARHEQEDDVTAIQAHLMGWTLYGLRVHCRKRIQTRIHLIRCW